DAAREAHVSLPQGQRPAHTVVAPPPPPRRGHLRSRIPARAARPGAGSTRRPGGFHRRNADSAREGRGELTRRRPQPIAISIPVSRALHSARAYTVRSAAPITPAESPSRFATIGVVSSSLKT